VRKAAHITEYLVLAICVAWPLWRLKLRSKKLFFITFISCVAYAGTDEFHQLFIEGRSGSLKDVGIDSIGCAVGFLLFCFVALKIERRASIK
jgi:VanZ family protein